MKTVRAGSKVIYMNVLHTFKCNHEKCSFGKIHCQYVISNLPIADERQWCQMVT